MNGRNRHLQYRRSVYRRRQIRFGLILTVVIVAVLIVTFLIVGNLLFKKDQPESNSPSKNDPPAATGEEHAPVPPIKARSVLLETADSSTFATRIDAMTETGATAASIPLTTADGALLYHSSVGTRLGYPLKGSPSVSISSAMAQIGNTSIHCSGVFYLTAFSEEDPLIRQVELSRCAAILAEATQQGMDDILLIAPTMEATHIDELLRFAEDIRLLAPNSFLGFALPQSILSNESSTDLIDRLWGGMDFLALNASEYGDENFVDYALSIVNDSSMMYNRLRYDMRILLPSFTEAEKTEAVIAAVEEAGVQSWQIIS